ncbi:hypothetical protein ABEB36_011470 [Hypothenemus hampei]|uniref:Uncharacterized protein n=1 Tax=Hypothenemus hampei TaxID=57062 RepID=A0ABD1EFK8_HYPHA
MNNLLISCIIIVFWIPSGCRAKYRIPNLEFEVFKPSGLKVSLPAETGVELFAFHAKVNQPILQIEPGDISQDVKKSVNGKFTYFNPDVMLQKGDVLNYWVFVQHNRFGYRKDEQIWIVNEISSNNETQDSVLKDLCIGNTIGNYTFKENFIDAKTWLIEEYIPGDPDWQFNIYKNSPDIIEVKNGVLHIKPKLQLENARIDLNLTKNCTRHGKECSRSYLSIWNPPIVSGQLRSVQSFCFANVTIKAKLPIGDYVYPEIYLEDVSNPRRRILIAFSRGNMNYERNGVDEGGKRLLGGPYINMKKPDKISGNSALRSYSSREHIGTYWHVFHMSWTPVELKLYIDDLLYGEYDSETLQREGFNKNLLMKLVIGIAAGGPYEFPDQYTSSGIKKPYNLSRDAIKQFVNNQDLWKNTWSADTQLQVEYVYINAV